MDTADVCWNPPCSTGKQPDNDDNGGTCFRVKKKNPQKHNPQCGTKPKVSGARSVMSAETKLAGWLRVLAKLSPSKREQSQIIVEIFKECEALICFFSAWSKTGLVADRPPPISPLTARMHVISWRSDFRRIDGGGDGGSPERCRFGSSRFDSQIRGKASSLYVRV